VFNLQNSCKSFIFGQENKLLPNDWMNVT